MMRYIHMCAALLSAIILASFWTSTLIAELFLSSAKVATVKFVIACALFFFVPLIMATALTGFTMGGQARHPMLNRKRRRMKFIAINGLLILVPCAILLSVRARDGVFDSVFIAIQTLEIVAGAINLILIGLNIRDGIRLRKLRKSQGYIGES